ERQRAGVVQVEHLDAVPAQALRALFRAGYGASDAMADPRQRVDEVRDRRPGPDPTTIPSSTYSMAFSPARRLASDIALTPATTAVSIAPPSPAAPRGASPCGSARNPRPAPRRGRGSPRAGSGGAGGARSRRPPGPSAAVRAWPWGRG